MAENGQMLGRAELIVDPVPADKRAKAVRTVAAKAHDVEDFLLLLDMCGLDPKEGVKAMTEPRYDRDNLPADGWAEYRKTQTTPMVRIEGPFTVDTREGPLHCEDGYLACPADGWPYPIAADYHAENYEVAE